MKYKEKSVFLKRARLQKIRRNFYYGIYLPKSDGLIEFGAGAGRVQYN